eukprot:Nk52_evm4s2554 gene=Nk52_evmTU4s2554
MLITLGMCRLCLGGFTAGETGKGKFRYQSLQSPPGFFYTGDTFQVEYLDTHTSVQWTVPSECTITFPVGSNTADGRVTCTSAGRKKLTVQKDNDATTLNTFYVTITDPVESRNWYIVAANDFTSATTSAADFVPNLVFGAQMSGVTNVSDQAYIAEARIWILDYAFADSAEKAGTALVPSTSSAETTASFQSLGEQPSLQGVGFNFTIVGITFSNKYWTVRYNTSSLPHEVALTITGQNTTILNVKVRDSLNVFTLAKYNKIASLGLDVVTDTGSDTTLGSDRFLRIYQDPISSPIKIALFNGGKGRFFFTQTDFETYNLVSIKSSAFPGNAAEVISSVVFTKRGCLFLTDLGAYATVDMVTFVTATGLPAFSGSSKINRVKGLFAGDSDFSPIYDNLTISNYVVAWSDSATAPVSNFYLSLDGGFSFAERVFPSASNVQQIHDIILSETVSFISVLCHVTLSSLEIQQSIEGTNDPTLLSTVSNADAMRSFNYDYKTSTWGESGSVFYLVSAASSPQITTDSKPPILTFDGFSGVSGQLYGGGRILIPLFTQQTSTTTADDTVIFYSSNSGKSLIPVPVFTRNTKVFHGTNNVLKQVCTSRNYDVVGLSIDNRIFLSEGGTRGFVELQTGILSTDVATLHFSSEGMLRVYKYSVSGASGTTTLAFTTVPTANEVESILITNPEQDFPVQECPFLSFKHNASSSIILDMNMNYSIWTQVVPLDSSTNIPKVVSYDQSLMSYTVSSDAIANSALGVNVVSRVFTFSHRAESFSEFSQKALLGTGYSTVEMSAAYYTMSCDKSIHTSAVTLGCPRNRFIKVVVAGEEQDDCAFYSTNPSISIDGDYNPDLRLARQGIDAGYATTVTYNSSKYGCPIKLFHGDDWEPSIELWEGDTRLESANAVYVMWDVHGRFDYKFIASASKAGCVSTPQTWLEMLASTSDPFEAWSKWNYINCTVPNVGRGSDLSGELEILKNGWGNGLRWTGRNEFYVFAVNVVDPQYSYCNYTTYVAVQVFGAPLPILIGIAIVFGITGGVFVILAVSYFWYRNKRKQEKVEMLEAENEKVNLMNQDRENEEIFASTESVESLPAVVKSNEFTKEKNGNHDIRIVRERVNEEEPQPISEIDVVSEVQHEQDPGVQETHVSVKEEEISTLETDGNKRQAETERLSSFSNLPNCLEDENEAMEHQEVSESKDEKESPEVEGLEAPSNGDSGEGQVVSKKEKEISDAELDSILQR